MQVARTTHSSDIFLRNFPRCRLAAILALIEPDIGPFDEPTPKTLQNQKWSGSDELSPFEFFQMSVSWSVGSQCYMLTLISCTHLRYVRNRKKRSARGVKIYTNSICFRHWGAATPILLTVDVPAVWLYVLRVDRRICAIDSLRVRVTVEKSRNQSIVAPRSDRPTAQQRHWSIV